MSDETNENENEVKLEAIKINNNAKKDVASITSGSESHNIADKRLRDFLSDYNEKIETYVKTTVDTKVTSEITAKIDKVYATVDDMLDQTSRNSNDKFVTMRVPTIDETQTNVITNKNLAKKQGFIWLESKVTGYDDGDGYGKKRD